MKSLIHDQSANAFLIIVSIFMMGIIALVYMISSDIFDFIIPVGLSVETSLSSANADSTFIRDLIIFVIKWIPVWFIIGLILWLYSMSQKPERSY